MYEIIFCIAYLLITWAGFDAIENFSRRQAPPTGKTDVFFRNRFRNGAVSILGSGVAYWLVPELLNVKNHFAAPAFIVGSLGLWRWAVRAEWNSATPKHRQVLMLTDLGRVFLQIWSSNAAGAVAQNDESRFAISVAGYLATLVVVRYFLKPATYALLREQPPRDPVAELKEEILSLGRDKACLEARIEKLEKEKFSLQQQLQEKQESEGPQDSR